MTTLLASVAAGVTLLALLAGCAAHLSRPRTLPDALTAHGLLPRRAVPPAARAVTTAETLLVLGGAAALLTGERGALTAVLTAATALFTSYALYTRRALTSGRGGPCGCSRTEVPLSGWVVGRAWAFAGSALLGAALTAGRAAPPESAARWTVVALAATTLTTLLWTLPAAMVAPDAARHDNRAGHGGHGGHSGHSGHSGQAPPPSAARRLTAAEGGH
ncbi:MauE/DoxX family redox-associated membrane protein [Streptomyces sedi]|uniref:Methylamine utilization protein MauE n=1 Tax=Streptomyces sedi TaxID=555059 RepID=A0A5C4VC68_9ACTN|nr:MauE/DoxX family redox-associated membrane protein [Streptomyces sedi]TNM33554.1 methylamine utilization protein MauE [Streptomyces sedi]